MRGRPNRAARNAAFIGSWRTPDVNRYLKIGLAAAAVLLVAAVGYQYLGNANTGGPGATETPQPTATPEPSSSAAGLPVGSSHVLWNAPGDIEIRVTIPAAGWFGEVGEGVLTKDNNPDPPEGTEIIVFQGPLYVYRDSCHWSTTTPDAPATTVDGVVNALVGSSRHPSSPFLAVEIGGYHGPYMSLKVPSSVDFALCDRGEFRSWVGDLALDNARYQGPGEEDALYILDVNGVPLIFDIGHYPGTPEGDMAEADAIVNSATFVNSFP